MPAGIREAALLLHRKVIAFDAFVVVRGSAVRRRQRYLGSNRDAASARQALESLQLVCAHPERAADRATHRELAEAALAALNVP